MRHSLLVVMLLAAVVAGCGGVEQEPNLAQASERTETAGSSRIEVRGRLTEGRELALRCDGAADYVRKRMRLACNDDFGEMIAIGDTMYMTSDELGADVDKRWVALPIGEDYPVLDYTPEKLLAMLRDASLDTVRVGEEDVRGEQTVRYRLTVNCEQAEIGCSGTTTPVSVWVDGDGLVRRIELKDHGNPGTVEFYDFGVEIDIEPPPADDVVEFSEVGPDTGRHNAVMQLPARRVRQRRSARARLARRFADTALLSPLIAPTTASRESRLCWRTRPRTSRNMDPCRASSTRSRRPARRRRS